MCFFVRKCVENISHGSAVIVVNIFFYVSKLAFLIKNQSAALILVFSVLKYF
jgi:hypothetical protein